MSGALGRIVEPHFRRGNGFRPGDHRATTEEATAPHASLAEA